MELSEASAAPEAAAAHVARRDRLFFAAVGLSALWIGAWGYFAPAIQKSIPFSVPPLHARFLGAMYLSAVLLELGGYRAKAWREAAIVPVMTAAWTGGIFLVSMLHTDLFDFGKIQTWIWFVAYAIYPFIALVQLLKHRSELRPSGGASEVPGWARRHLLVQGAALTILSTALFVAPGPMSDLWPWPITVALAQLYFAPFLAFGVGSLLLSGMTGWVQIKAGAVSLLVFTAAVLIASIIHRDLFSMREFVDVAWFAAFALAVLPMALITRKAYSHA